MSAVGQSSVNMDATTDAASPEQTWAGEGFCLFAVSRAAVAEGAAKSIPPYLERHGWELLWVEELASGNDALRALQSVAWIGRLPAAGLAEVAIAIAALNLNVLPPTRQQRKDFPTINDRRIPATLHPKHSYRGRPERIPDPYLAATADGGEAWQCFSQLLPHRTDEIHARATKLRAAFHTPESVIKKFGNHGNRAKVELIDFRGQRAVRKTFRPSQRRFYQRELLAREKLRHIRAMPGLLAKGNNWIVTPFYQDIPRYRRAKSSGHLIPLRYAKAIFSSIQEIHASGYFLLDFTPSNVIIDRRAGVKFIDLEFLQPYREVQPRFEEGYSIKGVPESFTGDVPHGPGSTYTKDWLPCVGLSLESLLQDPVPVQHLKRIRYRRLRFAETMVLSRSRHSRD